MKKTIISLCILGVVGYNNSLSAANMNKKKHQNGLDKKLSSIIMQNSLTGNPLKDRTVPKISDKKAQLGMDLFFSKTLGGDFDSACVACHHPVFGGGDNLPLPIGVEADLPDELGPGRTNETATHNPGEPSVPRNAPTTFNVIAWDKFQFHDGRVESLDKIPGANGAGPLGIRTPDSETIDMADENAGSNLVHAQARFPVTSNEEMKGFQHTGYTNQTIRELLAGRLGAYGNESDALDNDTLDLWLTKFRDALSSPDAEAQDLITEQNVSMMIAEYERSQAFVDTPWKKYIEGDIHAISKNAKKGAILFYTSIEEGGADCSSCHTGDFFTDESFHNLAMPQIGAGKGDGTLEDNFSKDFGRARETGNEAEKFAFRTPSLINVEMTGPWSHAGAYTTLEAVIKHHLDPATAIANYDASQVLEIQEGIRNIEKIKANTEEALDADSFFRKEQDPIQLSNLQVGFLVEFLRALTDPCTQSRECLSPWIPEPNSNNTDQLDAVDGDGNPL